MSISPWCVCPSHRHGAQADYQEYVPGGDFRTLLNNSGVLKEEHARFYAAEMFMGVNELHKLGYIHRDLKPEVHGTPESKLVYR
jgi:non-specific serine/threonine protein kinase